METYKSGQGSFARLSAFLALFLAAFLGARELYSWIADPERDTSLIPNVAVFQKLPLLGAPLSWQLLLCVAIFAGLVWLIRFYMRKPATVDLLIETELELKKVSWPTREESINATWIVIFVTLLITFTLFAFDIILQRVFAMLF